MTLNSPSSTAYQPVHAPRGATLSCKGWQQEAALRMLMNSLDPEVAERPSDLIVCCGAAKPVRDWDSFHSVVASLRALENDETMIIESGKTAGIVRTTALAPRVLMVSRNGDTANWAYTGSQGPLLIAYETFGAAARRHFGGRLSGRLVIAGGMGGSGGSQALAATLHGAAFLGIDADPERIKRRLKTGYCDVMVNDLDEALRILKNAVRKREAASVGLIGNCAALIPELAARGVVADLLTDQTSAHDPVEGYIPQGLTVEQAQELRRRDVQEYRNRALDSIAAHVRGMLEMQRLGAVAFEFGNGICAAAHARGVEDAFKIPGLAAEYPGGDLDEAFQQLQWVALSGEASDIARADRLVLELFPENERLTHWLAIASKHIRFQGLPAHVALLAPGDQARFGVACNDLVAQGELRAPILLARDRRIRSFASSGEDDPAAALIDAASGMAPGASWVSLRRCAVPANAEAQSVGVAFVADGAREMAKRIERGLVCADD